jgi:hypothetical protein
MKPESERRGATPNAKEKKNQNKKRIRKNKKERIKYLKK